MRTPTKGMKGYECLRKTFQVLIVSFKKEVKFLAADDNEHHLPESRFILPKIPMLNDFKKKSARYQYINGCSTFSAILIRLITLGAHDTSVLGSN